LLCYFTFQQFWYMHYPVMVRMFACHFEHRRCNSSVLRDFFNMGGLCTILFSNPAAAQSKHKLMRNILRRGKYFAPPGFSPSLRLWHFRIRRSMWLQLLLHCHKVTRVRHLVSQIMLWYVNLTQCAHTSTRTNTSPSAKQHIGFATLAALYHPVASVLLHSVPQSWVGCSGTTADWNVRCCFTQCCTV